MLSIRSLFIGPAFAALCACSSISAEIKRTDPYAMNLGRCNQVVRGKEILPVRDPVNPDKPSLGYQIIRHTWNDENRTTSCMGQIFNTGAFRCECSVRIPLEDSVASPDGPLTDWYESM